MARMLAPGAILQNRYEVVRTLGAGGAGTTYLVRDLVLDAEVALKLLSADAPALVSAFRAEFSVLRGLAHPHLCQVHDLGAVRAPDSRIEGPANAEPGPTSIACFYTAEHVDGVQLDTYATGRPWGEIARPIAQAADALGFLHALGVRHGDVKPENVLVETSGRAVLIDLGCSRPLGARTAEATEVSGTPGFLAPELLRGEAADHRADLYAFGVTLERIASRIAGSLPASVERLAARLTRADPGDRPADIDEVLRALGDASWARRPAVTGVEPPRLLGRRAEMDAFTRALADLIEGRPGPRGLVLHGPDGIGRSRLLREMKWEAELRCAVAEGHASRAGLGAAPVASMLRRAVSDASLPGNVAGVLRTRERLNAAGEPVALFLDDVHRVSESERELLLAALRILSPSDRFLIVVTQQDAPPPLGAAVRSIAIPSLEERDVAAWAGPHTARRRVADLMRLTGGVPAVVRDLLLCLAGGEGEGAAAGGAERDLDAVAAGMRMSAARADRLRALDPEAQRALAEVAALGSGEAADREVLARLSRDGWIVPDSGGFRLARLGDAATILEALGPEVTAPLHRRAASRFRERLALPDLPRAEASACAAALVVHLCLEARASPLAGTEAERVAASSRALFEAYPEGWPRAAAALAAARPPERGAPGAVAGLLAADVYDAAGQPREALRLVASVVRCRPDAGVLARAWLGAGASYLKLGDSRRALRYLSRAASSDALRAPALERMSRAHIGAGAYAEALDHARRALALCEAPGRAPDPALLAHVHDDIGVAASYLGDTLTARAHLRRAAALHEAAGNGHGVARSAACEAINEFRTGDAAAAVVGFRGALDAAERAGTDYQIASAVLNLGTACHQEGDLGEALAAYERGLAMAIALGKRSTEATLEHNLAKLYADIGLFERAEAAARGAADKARAAGLALIAASSSDIEGEVALALGDPARALALFDAARRDLLAQTAAREVAEVDLHRAEAHFAAGDDAAAAADIAYARAAADDLAAPDVSARVDLTDARLLARTPADAIVLLARAQRLAHTAGQRLLRADIEAALAAAYAQQGDRGTRERGVPTHVDRGTRERGVPTHVERAAHQHRARAQGLWEGVLASLPAHLADAFWRHPRRAAFRPDPLPPPPPPARGSPEARRLADINRKLSACARTDEVLGFTMDSAIELTGAERGFVILAKQSRHEPELEVAVARNIDREDILRSHLKFSKGIADRVILTGDVVVCHDAQIDERFAGNRSVHAMRLRSIVCVPIRGRSGILGALYLDHRYERGRFDAADTEILTAFADQAAIALQSARPPSPPGAPAQDRAERPPPARRHDYGSIVSRSASMQAVLAVLDRVMDSSVNLLVQGESGTGKELVARAMHDSGPRRKGPFVALNCGAAGGEGLLESELFGHVRGAFTGAVADRAGLFEAASGGTLFLDEIGEMPNEMQIKLLRVLQEREVRRVGSSKVTPIDIRLVCATNRVLRDEVAAGRFRKDLFYRVGVVEVTLPPLRDRVEDLPELCDQLLARIAAAQGRPVPTLTADARRLLAQHPFPGNVRELENVLTKAVLLVDGERIGAADLARTLDAPAPPRLAGRAAHEAEEAARIAAALRETGWNASEACRLLGMPRATFYRKLKRYGIEVGRRDGAAPRE